ANFAGRNNQPLVEVTASCLGREIEIGRVNDAHILRGSLFSQYRSCLDHSGSGEKRSENDSKGLFHQSRPCLYGPDFGATVQLVPNFAARQQQCRAIVLQNCRTETCWTGTIFAISWLSHKKAARSRRAVSCGSARRLSRAASRRSRMRSVLPS